jgi:hypothetical protein
MNPRLDIRDFIAGSDYLVQLSDTEAWSYSVLESLVLGTPVIVTPIPCFEEMGIKSGVNGYMLPFNMKDIPINEIYNNIPKFEFKAPKDIYDKLLIKEPSTYDPSKKVDAICIKRYTDVEHNCHYKKNDIVKNITIERYEYLKGLGLVE